MVFSFIGTVLETKVRYFNVIWKYFFGISHKTLRLERGSIRSYLQHRVASPFADRSSNDPDDVTAFSADTWN